MKKEFEKALLAVLGQRIRDLRTERGYSQEGFADKCGVHRTFMGTIERGESNLSFQNIAKVAAGLGVPIAELFLNIEANTQALVSRPRKSAKTAKTRRE